MFQVMRQQGAHEDGNDVSLLRLCSVHHPEQKVMSARFGMRGLVCLLIECMQ